MSKILDFLFPSRVRARRYVKSRLAAAGFGLVNEEKRQYIRTGLEIDIIEKKIPREDADFLRWRLERVLAGSRPSRWEEMEWRETHGGYRYRGALP